VNFFNPFDLNVMDGVMANLEKVAMRHSVVVGYEGPNPLLMDRYPWVALAAEGPNVRLFGGDMLLSPSTEEMCIKHSSKDNGGPGKI